MPTQNLLVNMPVVYNSSYQDMGLRVKDKYATNYQTKLQWAWGRLKNVMTAEQFQSLWVTFAEAMDGAWTQESPGNLISGYQNTYTKVLLPKGKFLLNANGNMPRGGFGGESSFMYAGGGADQGQVATEFVMPDDPNDWIGSGERRMWSTPNADRTDNYAYNESFELSGVRLTMPINKNDDITRVGWYLKRCGSTSYGNQLQANGGSKGFVFVDGVPAVFGTIRAFYSSEAGASFEGGWGADLTITKLECDGCARPFQVLNTSDGNGGGLIRIGLKIETGITAGIPAPGSYCYLEGQYDVEVSINASYGNGVKPAQGSLFVVKPVIANGSLQGSRLQVSGKGFGYGGNVLKNLVTGRVFGGLPDYDAFKFEHYAKKDKFYSNTDGLPNDTKDGTTTPPVDPPPVNPPAGLTPIATTNWKATANKNNTSTTEGPNKAIDGNDATRYTTGAPQASGDWWMPDMQTAVSVRRLWFNTAPSAYDFPTKFKFQVSLDKTIWKDVSAEIAGGQGKTLYEATFTATAARYWRILLTASTTQGSWLSIFSAGADT